MRAPLCPDSTDLSPEEQGQNGSETDCKRDEIHALEKSLEKKHSNKTAVFGICLDILMGNSPQVAPHVPFVLSRLCRYIEAHGLRHKSLFIECDEKNLVESLKVEFIESGDAPLESVGNVSSAAKLLIIFFEELPEPLIPRTVQPALIKDIENLSMATSDYARCLKCVVCRLPDCTFNVLKYLSKFLMRVAQHQEHNGMSSDTMGLIFGPLIFRTSKTNHSVLEIVKNVVNCFVKDYHTVFGSDVTSPSEESPQSSTKPSFTSSDVTPRRQLPCPSSVMPLMTLQPLSVVIPSVDQGYEATEKCNDSNGNVPILLIESQIEKLAERNKANQMCTKDSTICKDKTGVSATRKRKERRLSGEDSQVQRSSSEERPSPITTVSNERSELMRRCSSHEEMKDLLKSDVGNIEIISGKKITERERNSQPVDSYFADSLELVLGDKDHSPHPPNAKRREVEASSLTKMETLSQEKPFTRTPDFVTRPWKNSSQLENSDKGVSVSEKSLNLDVKCQYVFKQDSLLEMESENTMDCSASNSKFVDNDDDLDSTTITPDDDDEDEDEFYNNKKARIPRSASCPVPNAENENCSDSDNSSLSLSWSMLFESEDSEPMRSEQRFSWPASKDIQEDNTLLSPSVQSLRKSSFYEAPLSPSAYRSYLSYRSTHLDPSVPPSPPVEQEDFAKSLDEGSGISDSIKQLTKKIHGLKKKIRRFDEKFEAEFGYKPSHAEKSNHPDAKKLMSDLHKARKDLKALKEESHLEHVSSGTSWHPHRNSHILGDTTNYLKQDAHKDKSKPSVEDSLGETLKSLAEGRRFAKRPESVEAMTTEQVKDEKVAIQKALLNFESIHGKPSKKDDRNTIRPLYDRYRSVKKLLVRSGSFPGAGNKNKDSCTELQPILEHETMDFTSPQHRTNVEIPTFETEIAESKVVEEAASKIESTTNEEVVTDVTTCSQFLTSKYNNSNIHELPLSEMIFQLQQSKSEKRRLRKILREFETEFQRLNGRKVQKEDKAPVEALYAEYKHVKARLKLLEALVSKHDQHQIM